MRGARPSPFTLLASLALGAFAAAPPDPSRPHAIGLGCRDEDASRPRRVVGGDGEPVRAARRFVVAETVSNGR